MSRMFEIKQESMDGETIVVIDLEKVCSVRVKKPTGHHLPRVAIRFVDGREAGDVVPEEYAHHLLDAYRAYLGGGG